jgi:hypothetical protein
MILSIHDTKHKDSIDDTQQNDSIHDTQHKLHSVSSAIMLSRYVECHYAECRGAVR